MTTTLTERYIVAATSGLARVAADDVRAELEASIADAIDARVEDGDERADAERAVLTELGDPAILAAGYADRPLHLIGPRYYLIWWRLLKLLLAIIPPVAVGGVILAQSFTDASIGEIIGSAIAVGFSTIVQVAFWVTLVFAIVERTGTAAVTGAHWNIEQLPEPKTDDVGRGSLITSLAFLALATGVLLWDRLQGFVFPHDGPLPILNPDLWPWPISGLFILIAAEAALSITITLVGRWTTGLAIANTALAAVFMSLMVTLLARGDLINPEFVSFVFTDNGVYTDDLRVFALITGFAIVGFASWDIVDGWRKAARANRS